MVQLKSTLKLITMRIILFTLLGLIFLTSCEKNQDNYPKVKDFLCTWELISMNDKIMDSIIHYPDSLERIITLEFNSDSTIRVEGYCNYGDGKYKLNKNSILIYDVGFSEVACYSEGATWEYYLKVLNNVNGYKLKNQELTLLTVCGAPYDLIFRQLEVSQDH